jgi:hypothetical protein
MLGKLCPCLAVLAALAAAPAAAGDGPLFTTQGGTGVVSSTGGLRYVTVGVPSLDRTTLEAIQTSDGSVVRWTDLAGSWGVPTVGYGYPSSFGSAGQGLSRDGHALVLGSAQAPSSPSSFLVVDPRRMTVVKRIALPGFFSYDALSPDGSLLYLIQYTEARSGDLDHYVVRAYDLDAGRLLPGRIADRTQTSWVMQGAAVTRTTSPEGRWVYTLYQNPGGYPFIHALDTVRGVAHCVGLPMSDQNAIFDIALTLHGRTLFVHWRSGRRWLDLDTVTWRLSPASGRFPALSAGLGAGGGALTRGALAAALRRRRRADAMDRALDELLEPRQEVAA